MTRAWFLLACFGFRTVLGGASLRAQTLPQPWPPAPLAYDLSAYELAPTLREPKPWTADEPRHELLRRVALEKRRQELDVDYYRIGYTLSFPLPLRQRPAAQDLPVAIPQMAYPWVIWLSWDLEERWRLLHFAWRQAGDPEAGRLLQQELAALAEWDHLGEANSSVGLATAHLAASLALALAQPDGWQPEQLRQARAAADKLLERDVWPWFNQTWAPQALTPNKLANIPVIALVRSAQLARVLDSPHREALEQRSREVLQAWCRLRLGPEHHTEGAAYDGYLMDSITEWLEGLPDRAQVKQQSREALLNLAESWLALTVPGRPDLQAPLGDVEPEMTFWATALMRVGEWYELPEARWLVRQFPLARLRAAALVGAAALPSTVGPGLQPPAVKARELPQALSLRTGWDSGSVLAVVGLSRGVMGHLHNDDGQLILGWQGRCWITDAGYQQYRPGEERDYTLGLEAHNVPVLDGMMQTSRAPRVEQLETDTRGRQHARVDVSRCYRNLPSGGSLQREVWLLEGGAGVVVRDTFKSLSKGVKVSTSWQAGNHFAWAFRQGWTRLSDGQRALWVGTFPGQLDAAQVKRHAGSRGPLTLTHTATLPEARASAGGSSCVMPPPGGSRRPSRWKKPP